MAFNQGQTITMYVHTHFRVKTYFIWVPRATRKNYHNPPSQVNEGLKRTYKLYYWQVVSNFDSTRSTCVGNSGDYDIILVASLLHSFGRLTRPELGDVELGELLLRLPYFFSGRLKICNVYKSQKWVFKRPKLIIRFRNSTVHLQFVAIYRDLLFLTDPPKVGQH